jgi:hypothetical protein
MFRLPYVLRPVHMLARAPEHRVGEGVIRKVGDLPCPYNKSKMHASKV